MKLCFDGWALATLYCFICVSTWLAGDHCQHSPTRPRGLLLPAHSARGGNLPKWDITSCDYDTLIANIAAIADTKITALYYSTSFYTS